MSPNRRKVSVGGRLVRYLTGVSGGAAIGAVFMGWLSDVPSSPVAGAIAGAIIGGVFGGRLVGPVGRSITLAMLAGAPLGVIVTGHSKGALSGSFWGIAFGVTVGLCLESRSHKEV